MAIGDEFKSSGITENTPKTIMLGAGTIHKGLTFTAAEGGNTGTWNFENSLICATSGGSKLSIVPELYDVPVDGALVKIKGLTVKVGETATLEINPVELTPEVLKMAVIGDSKTSTTAKGYDEITSRAVIGTGDYIENLGYVGKPLRASRLSLFLIMRFVRLVWSLRERTRKRPFQSSRLSVWPTFPRKPTLCRGTFIIRPRRHRKLNFGGLK